MDMRERPDIFSKQATNLEHMAADEIAQATDLCLSRFKALTDFNESSTLSTAWLEEQEMLLDLWSSVLGVFAPGKHSVAYRLRKNTAYAQAILQLLHAIQANLQSLFEICVASKTVPEGFKQLATLQKDSRSLSKRPSYANEAKDDILIVAAEEDNVSDSDSTDSTDAFSSLPHEEKIKLLQKQVSTTLHDLLRFATLIRQYSSKKQSEKADSYQPTLDDFDSEGTHDRGDAAQSVPLILEFEQFADGVLKREFGPNTFQSTPRDYLKTRLAQMMVKKWRRTCYRYAHAKRLRKTTSDDPNRSLHFPDRSFELALSFDDTVQQGHSAPIETARSRLPRPKYTTRTFSESAATTFPEHLPVLMPKQLKTVSAKSTSRVEEIDANLPQLPSLKATKGGYLYTCPYCGVPQEVEKRSDQVAWKTHLWADLTPYICLYEQCAQSDTEYGTVHEWRTHMQQHSETTWRCGLCQDMKHGQTDLTANEYSSDTELRHHLMEYHPSRFKNSEISIALKFSKHQSSPEVCFICDSDVGIEPDGVGYTATTAAQHNDNLFACMSAHLEALALSCLPWRIGARHVASSSAAQGSDKVEETKEASSIPDIARETNSTGLSLEALRQMPAINTSPSWQNTVMIWSFDSLEPGNEEEHSELDEDFVPETLYPHRVTHGPVVCKYPGCGRTFQEEHDLAVHLGTPHGTR